MDKIYGLKFISLDEYKNKKTNKRKFSKDKEDDLDLIEQFYLKDISNKKIAKTLNIDDIEMDEKLNRIKFKGMKDVADMMDKIFKSF